jgi:LysR family transcriptional activator of dmlA
VKNRHNIDGLVLFYHINQLGSLSAAAQLLGINRSTVSKKLAVLEKSIGVRLLKRTTRKIVLTEVGRKVLQEARKVETALRSIEYISDDFQSVIAGDLNITCAAAQGRAHVVPLLARFLKQYPMINVNLQLEDRFVDMIAENVDVSIRIGYLPDSTLIARKVGDLSGVLCASPEYLRIAPRLRSPSDLLNHRCLIYKSLQAQMNTWSFASAQGEEQVTVAGHLSVNDPEALIKAACEHAGVLLADRGLVGDAVENGSLVTVLSDYECVEQLPMYVVYPYKKFMPTKTRLLIDFLLKELPPYCAS